MQHIPEVSLVRNDVRSETWTVVAVNADGDGGIDETTFSGPAAEARARDYAKQQYACLEPELVA
jgi:hypothetical protein